MEPYSYSFLRYHHEPLSGEFVNIGLLLWAPKSQYLGFQATENSTRLSQFFGGFDPSDYKSLIKRLDKGFQNLASEFSEQKAQLALEDRPESARDVATRVVPHDSAALRWSPSRGGLTKSPQVELANLYARHILHHSSLSAEQVAESAHETRDARTVYRQHFEQAFKQPLVSKLIRTHHVQTDLTDHLFPQAWKNGVWNVYETLSFDLVRPDTIRNKAHKYESLTRWIKEDQEINVTYLLGKPSSNKAAYDTARKLLKHSKASLIEEDEAKDFASELKSKVTAAQQSS